MRRLTALLLSFAFFGSAALIMLTSLPNAIEIPLATTDGLAGEVSAAVADALTRLPYLPDIAPRLALHSKLPRDGIYVTDTMLIEDLAPLVPDKIEMNTSTLLSFTDRLTGWYNDALHRGEDVRRRPVYFMLIPTASAIKAQWLPLYAYPIDQKGLISSIYYQSGLPAMPAINTVRAYEALERAADKYIYYRTDSALTGLGGYFLYTNIASAMRLNPQSLGRFNVTNAILDYRGRLDERVHSPNIRSDLVSVYSFADEDCRYRVIHHTDNGPKYYSSLFPEHLRRISGPADTVLGGLSPRVDVRTSSNLKESLLILADETVMSYIGFLTVHFKEITILDINTLDQSIAQDVDVLAYDRILIGISIDSYGHSDNLAEALDLMYYRISGDDTALPEAPTQMLES